MSKLHDRTDRTRAKIYGSHMLFLGLVTFLVGVVFWIQATYGFRWYESLTILGLVFFMIGWLKRLAS